MLIIKGPRQSYWLVDSITNVHICNDQRLMTKYTKKSIRVRGSIADRVSLNKEKVKIRYAKKDSLEGLVLILIDVFYLSDSSSNLISLGFLNNTEISYHNKNQIFYN